MVDLSRRGFLGGLLSAIAAPAIVKAEILMPVKKVLIVPDKLLTIDEITRQAIELWKNSNAFIENVNNQYGISFARYEYLTNGQVRITKIPNEDIYV